MNHYNRMRYKEYNVNSVLEKSIQLYWSKGYKACSITDIVELTGVNRFSLYHEFEDKNGILYNSLRLYRERHCESKFEILKQAGDTAQVLTDFLFSFLNKEANQQGCYFIHIGTELADTDQKINALVKDYLSEIEELFTQLLKRDPNTEENAFIYARQLIGLFCSTMSFCLIQPEAEQALHISSGINVILKKSFSHA